MATVAGQQYKCKFSFAASMRLAEANLEANYPVLKLTPESTEEAKRQAVMTVIRRNLIVGSCTLGTETPEGKWQTIGLDADQIQEAMLPGEYAVLVAAISEANRLAEEAQKAAAAQTAPPKTTEPGTIQ